MVGELTFWEILTRALLGAGLGAAVGLERELDGQDAGVRTHLLLSLGSALFGLVSVGAFNDYVGTDSRDERSRQRDPDRLVAREVIDDIFSIDGSTIASLVLGPGETPESRQLTVALDGGRTKAPGLLVERLSRHRHVTAIVIS